MQPLVIKEEDPVNRGREERRCPGVQAASPAQDGLPGPSHGPEPGRQADTPPSQQVRGRRATALPFTNIMHVQHGDPVENVNKFYEST